MGGTWGGLDSYLYAQKLHVCPHDACLFQTHLFPISYSAGHVHRKICPGPRGLTPPWYQHQCNWWVVLTSWHNLSNGLTSVPQFPHLKLEMTTQVWDCCEDSESICIKHSGIPDTGHVLSAGNRAWHADGASKALRMVPGTLHTQSSNRRTPTIQ